MFWISWWHTLECLFCLTPARLSVCLFCLTSAGLERMKHVLGGQLKRPSPCRIRSAPGRDRLCGLSETSEKCAKFSILGRIRPGFSWSLAYAELERKKHLGKHVFPSWLHCQILASYFVPTTVFSMSHLEAFGLLQYDCYVVAFWYQIWRLITFVRAFVVFEGGRSLPSDTVTPSVRTDSSF